MSPGSNYLDHTFFISFFVFSRLQWMYLEIKDLLGQKQFVSYQAVED